MSEKGIKHRPGSAVTNLPKIQAAKEAAEKAASIANEIKGANPDAGDGKSPAGKQTSQAATQTQKELVDTRESARKPAAESKPNKPGVSRQIASAEQKAAGHAATARRGSARVIKRDISAFKKMSGGHNFIQSSGRNIRYYAGIRSTYRCGISRAIRSYGLKSVLRSLAAKAPKLGLRLVGTTFGAVMYVWDTSELASGSFPAWREKYHKALNDFARTDDPLVAINELRRMNSVLFDRQKIDNLSFILVMTSLGESFNQNPAKQTAILNNYKELTKQYKSTLLKAAEEIEKNVSEAERIYKEVQSAYSWNTAYMSHVNRYHLPYIKKFKQHALKLKKIAHSLRTDTVAASADLNLNF